MNTYTFNRINIVFVAFALLLLPPAVWATGTYADGDGSQDNPFQINTAVQMAEIGQHPEDWASYFILTADIDMSGQTLTPVGNSSSPFIGNFDGAGYVISNAAFNVRQLTNYVGLFGYTGADCEIRDLGIVNIDVTAVNNRYIGSLAGYNCGTINSCYRTGAMTLGNFHYHVGGLVGYNCGTINSCHCAGPVSGHRPVGGLVGENSGTISNCYSTGAASGVYSAAGVAGYNSGTINSCYATGQMSSQSLNGGLVGTNYGTISGCYATGTVNGSVSGGLVGENYSTINNCYATGPVSGDHHLGGLVGHNYDTISNCYAAGKVSGDQSYRGGLVGRSDSGTVIIGSFWDIGSGSPNNGLGIALTTEEMKSQASFTDYGWDFVNIWTIREGVDYPRFIWEAEPVSDSDGDGVSDDQDAFPNDPTEWADNDNDGIGDNADLDDDNDGLSDTDEVVAGTDPCNPDTDGDGVSDGADALPNDPQEWADNDNDGMGDNADLDDDNDALSDSAEATMGTDPFNPDTDGDGLLDGTEVEMAQGSGCPDPSNPDSDDDTLWDGAEVDAGTNPCDVDSDGDDIPDNIDPYPLSPEGTESYIEAELRDIAYNIQNFELDIFTGPNNNANKGRRGALSNRFDAAANAAAEGQVEEAIDILNSLLDRVDGIDVPKDWIEDSIEKEYLVFSVFDMIDLSEYLI
jgi:hypothetical protein